MNPLRRAVVCTARAAIAVGAMLALACGDDPISQPGQPQAVSQQATPQQVGQESGSQADAASTETIQQESGEQLGAEQSDQQSEQASPTQPTQQQDIQPNDEGQQQAPTATGDVNLTVEPILDGYQFHQPIEMLSLPDGSFLVAEQRGYVTRFIEEDGEITQIGILDLTESVSFGGEQGLLSMALHPQLQDEPYLYVYYSPSDASVTRLSRIRIVQGVALSASELVIIEIPQPYRNHNGGAVRFGPDGMLYLGIGDGGAANDPHGHGQNRETLLGAIIRIDVNDIDTSTPYRIPPDNPFLGVTGVRPEIWAWGLRNPWRMAFDPETGDLWVGDVGQDRVEEIAMVAAGENHGWNVFEGHECFRSQEACDALPDAVPPVATYTHDDGCSVTGGEVYRGRAMPQLRGSYVFGDYCSRIIWTIAPDGAMQRRLQLDDPIASFATDNDGEIYVLTFNGPILKLVPEGR